MIRQIFRVKTIIAALVVVCGLVQIASAQSSGKTTTKSALVDEIIALTMPSVPVAVHQEMYDMYRKKLPDYVAEQAKKAAVRDVDAMNISAAQKKAAKDRIPTLMVQAKAPLTRLVNNRFPDINVFLVQFYKEGYSQFSVGEIMELNRFLVTDPGKSYLKSVKTIVENMSGRKPKPLEIEAKHRNAIGLFLNNPTGKRFNDTLAFSPDVFTKKLELLTAAVFTDMAGDAEITKIYEDFKESAAN